MWVTDSNLCRKLAEEMAQAQFIKSGKDPFEGFLFYVAVRKKRVAAGLVGSFIILVLKSLTCTLTVVVSSRQAKEGIGVAGV